MASSRVWMPMARSAVRTGLKKEAYGRVLQRHNVRFYNSKKQPDEKYMIWRPYLRLAIGIPFVGALIYSMVRWQSGRKSNSKEELQLNIYTSSTGNGECC